MNPNTSTVALVVCVTLFAGACRAQEKPVATMDGAPIYERDLDVKSQLAQVEQQAYQVRLRALESLIERRLLEKAAAKEKLTVEEFLKREVDDKVPEPSPQEVEGFYWAQKDRVTQPLEVARPQLARNLKSIKAADARQRLLRSLRESSKVAILLDPPRMSVVVGNAPRKGVSSAPITIVEFSDYQCPYCKRATATIREVLLKYEGKVSLVYKDLPLPMHPEAQRAAEAARCAGESGKYWEYHDALFAAASLTRDSYAQLASSIGVEPAKLQSCLDSGKHRAAVQADAEQAKSLGISGTPAFLINGIFLSGAQPAEAFTRIIDQELERIGANRAGG